MEKVKFNRHVSLNLKVTYLCILVSVVLLCLKFFALRASHALSIKSSLIDSVSDLIMAMVNSFALYKSVLPPSNRHRFGLGKIEGIVGLFQAFLMLIGGVWVIYDALFLSRVTYVCGCDHTMGHNNMQAIYFMLSGMLLTFMLVVLQNYVLKKSASLIIEAEFIHYMGDLAIGASIIVSLFTINYYKSLTLDLIIASSIALFVLYRACRLLKFSLAMLLDAEISENIKQQIVNIISTSHGAVHSFSDLRTRRSGDKLFVQCKLNCNCNLTVAEFSIIEQTIYKNMQQHIPNVELFLTVGK